MNTEDQIARVKNNFEESIRVKQQSLQALAVVTAQAASLIALALDKGGKILSCGSRAPLSHAGGRAVRTRRWYHGRPAAGSGYRNSRAGIINGTHPGGALAGDPLPVRPH